MKRRAVDVQRDYDRLLYMQRLNWQINFPGQVFFEPQFRFQLASGAKRGEIFIYEQECALVGWLWLDLSRPGMGNIRHIQVEQAHWGKGIGRRIMEDAIGLYIGRKCRRVTLSVTKSNHRAMTLYEHLGFVVAEDLGERQRMALDLRELTQEGQNRAKPR